MRGKTRRLISAALTIVMVLSLLVVPAAADGTAEIGDFWDFAAPESAKNKAGEAYAAQVDCFETDRFENLTLTSVKYHSTSTVDANGTVTNEQFGSAMSNGASIEIKVPGDCNIVVRVGYQWSLQLGDDAATKISGSGGFQDVTFHYQGAAGSTATLKATGTAYVGKVTLAEFSMPPAALTLASKDGVVVKEGGEAATVTPSVTNATMGAVTATSNDSNVATATVNDGVISIAPVGAGKTTVDVSVAISEADDGNNTPLTGTIAVRVLPAEVGTVTENTTYNFLPQTEAGKDTFYSPGLAWSEGMVQGGTDHGVNGSGGTLTVYIPEGKQTTLTVRTCQHGIGSPITATAGGAALEVNEEANSDGAKDQGGKKATLSNVSGTVVISFTGSVYVHSLEVGEFSDTTKEFEAKTWEFANDTFDPATTYEDLTITGGKATGVTYGMAFFADGSIVLPVNGPCDIVVTGSYAWDISLNGSKVEHEKTPAEGQADAEMTFYYTGNAGTATLNCGARTWIKSIELKEATPAADIPAKLAVEKTSVSLKLGSLATSKTDVAVYLRNAEAADVTAASDSEAVSVTYADGKLAIQGTAETETAATISVKLKGTEAATVKVTVAGAAPANVAEGEYILTDTSNADRLNVPGIDWGKFIVVNNNHGAISEGATTIKLNLSAPADVQLVTCPFGTGNHLTVSASSGTVSQENVNTCGGTDAEKGDIFGSKISIVGAEKGQLSITLTPTEGGAGDETFNVYDDVYLNYDEIWLKNLSVTYRAEVGANRNIDVWDLAGLVYGEEEFKFAGDKVVDNITPAIWVSSNALNNAQFDKAEATTFGDMTLTHNANDRIYSSVTGNADFIALLVGNAVSNYNQTFDDGFKSAGGFYANGTGSEGNRCVTFNRVAAGDKIIAYVGSSQNGDTVIHFKGQGSAAGQDDTKSVKVGTYERIDFVAEKEGSYKLYGVGGKPFYIRFIRVPAVAVSGAITLPEGFTATDYQVKFTNKTTKKATFATLGGDGTYTAALAAGYEYTAMLTGVPGYGFTVDTKNVTTTNAEALSGKENVDLVVEPKSTYTFSGKVTGFAEGYDASKLVITLIPEEGSGSDEVELEFTGLDFTAKLDPGVVYTLELSGVNDYVIDAPLSVTSEKDDVTQNITMKAKDLHTASGKFLGLGTDGRVTALTFENVDDGYTYAATVTADGYTAQLRDGAYSSKATVEGKYSTITHVVVNGKDVEKDLLFVSTDAKPAVTKVKDVYVGYAAKSPNFDTVTEALDAISRMGIASEADRVTVHIAPGTYREQLMVKTPYVTFINDEPDKGEVLLTWYYGIGYKYYSSNGYYDAQRAYDKFEKKIADRWGCAVRVTGKGFRAENITFENSFNRYITEEEILDGVELSGTESITVVRDYGTDANALAAQERAAAICVEANECEFYKCKFLSSQDTLYTNGTVYFKSCLLEGTTDPIFGDASSKCIFDGCELSFKGYSGAGKEACLTAVRTDAGQVGYLFRNCAITAAATNPKMIVPNNNSLGRPWAAKASVFFLNTKLERANLILEAGWSAMNSDKPENAQFAEFGTTLMDGTKVDTSKRVSGTVKTEAEANAQTRDKYFGSWVPYYYVEEAAAVAFEVAPTITDNGDINTPYPGHTLTVHYSLGEANDANDASIIKWSRVADDGTETVVKTTTAAVGKTYQITKADQGAKIKVTVTPTTVSGKTGEAKSITMDNKVREGFEDPDGKLDPELGDGVNVFLAGDSTVFDYKGRNEGSWGELLQNYLDKDKVTVSNHAQGGRSSRSFINEGRLDAIAANIKAGDFLLIQFGHNDCANEEQYRVERYAPLGNADANGKYPTTAGTKGSDGKYTWDCGGTYKWYLQQYIDVAKNAGATPILVTPVARLNYTADGTIRPHHDASYATNGSVTDTSKWDTAKDNAKYSNTYVTAVKQLAEENGIACIDAFQFTKDLYEDAYKACGESDKTTYGRQVMSSGDSTHSNKLGGMIQAALMAQAIKDLDVSISKTVKAPTMVQAKTTDGETVFTVDGKGVFTAYDMLSKPTAYGETAPYWMGVGQKLMDALKGAGGPTNPDDPTNPADKTALNNAIKDAQALADDTRVSTDGTDVLTKYMWVPQTAMDTYNAAIEAAKTVAAKADATDEELANAVTALAAATANFEKAQKEGTKPSTGSPAIGTVTKPDGTVTKPDGTVIKPDGTQITTNDKGDVATTVTKPNGDTAITVVNAEGETVAEITLPATASAPATKFVDVPEGHWAEKSINSMAALGMVKGVNEAQDQFDMNSSMTRGSIATMFFRLSNGAAGIANTFSDVAEGAWYADAIGWAAKTGVVNGYSAETFGPNDSITRQQLATMLCRFANLIGMDTTANPAALAVFADGATADGWAVDSLAWCVKNGIMKGRGGDVLDPTTEVTRAEAAVMFDRVLSLIK